jgi:uncharacterized membrane protein YgcG
MNQTGVRIDTHLFDQALWDRITDYTFDPPGTQVSFATRLSRETEWSPERTALAISEYRRFLYLAVRAGHPVTPSQAVDEVWHLHLMSTRQYWDVLCAKVLRLPLHHGPSLGGTAETAKFHHWYQHTLESYVATFGEAPPADLWPAPGRRFDRPSTRAVDTTRYWVIPKPAWPNWMRPSWMRRCRRTGALALVLALAPLGHAIGQTRQARGETPPILIAILATAGVFAVFNFVRWLIETPADREARRERERQKSSGGCGTSGGCGSSCGGGGCGGD